MDMAYYRVKGSRVYSLYCMIEVGSKKEQYA